MPSEVVMIPDVEDNPQSCFHSSLEKMLLHNIVAHTYEHCQLTYIYWSCLFARGAEVKVGHCLTSWLSSKGAVGSGAGYVVRLHLDDLNSSCRFSQQYLPPEVLMTILSGELYCTLMNTRVVWFQSHTGSPPCWAHIYVTFKKIDFLC